MMDDAPTPEPLVPLSAIEHYAYCPRQCALIHVEQSYQDNVYTVRGKLAHERVHGDGHASEPQGCGVYRGLALYSDRLGLVGRADLVEMRDDGPYPVEYKVGRVYRAPAELQLCGQAICLEEMLGQPVPRGAIYRAAARARREVEFTNALRERTLEAVEAVRDLLRRSYVPPPPENERLCRRCSLRDACLPEVVREGARLRGFQSALYRIYDDSESTEG